jgi:hypothetical protein
MTTNNEHRNNEAKWVDFDLGNLQTHPKDGSEVLVAVACGLKGPATYRSRSGFSLFNVPWRDIGTVEQWHYGDWSKRFTRTVLPL